MCYNVNAFAKADNGKIKAFLEYLKTQNAKDGFTQKLDGIVKRMKESNAVQGEFMMRNIFVDDWFDRGVAVGVEQGISQGRQEGISQGAHDKAVETARGMLTYGMPQEKVAEISSLPLTEIQHLAQEIAVL